MLFVFFALLPAFASTAVVGSDWARPQIPLASPDVDTSVPQYVLDYAPVIYLHSEEIYLPADISKHLTQTHGIEGSISVATAASPMTLEILNVLNGLSESDGAEVFLSSNKDYTEDAVWLHGVMPNLEGKTENATSCTVVVNYKGEGVVDAFYVYFYAYNHGGKVFGWKRFGDHLGDWEHTVVRFKDGQPLQAWYSQHGGGTAYKFSALQKRGTRPIGYSSNGTHATWATVGTHDHTIPGMVSPFGPLLDHTNKGRFWDPLLNAAFYKVAYHTAPPDSSSPTFTALRNPFVEQSSDSSTDFASPAAITTPNWLYFKGHWGNARLLSDHPEQRDFLNLGLLFKYAGAPNGPRFKQLNRVDVCEKHWWTRWCHTRNRLYPGS